MIERPLAIRRDELLTGQMLVGSQQVIDPPAIASRQIL
jgi:hypothetical protein